MEASQPEFKLVIAPLHRDLQWDVVSGMEQEPGNPRCCLVLLGLGAAGTVGGALGALSTGRDGQRHGHQRLAGLGSARLVLA